MKYRPLIIIALLIVAGAFIAYNFSNFSSEKSSKSIRTDKWEPPFKKHGELQFLNLEGTTISEIDIEIAETEATRSQGLMYRKNMEVNNGMLFIFDFSTPQSFWMKNTVIPLDILYVSPDLEIVKIYEHTIPFSETSLPSFKSAQYVVEVNAGYCSKKGIKEGDKIAFTRD